MSDVGIDLKFDQGQLDGLINKLGSWTVDGFLRQGEAAGEMGRYLGVEITRSFPGNISEGTVREVRGQQWRGWAQRTVEKYGEMVLDGTRFYMRRAQDTWTKVWKRRTSGQMYNESSEMMIDSGTMLLGITPIAMEIQGDTIHLAPNHQVAYFDYQNSMRPFFVLDPTVDEPVFAGLIQKDLDRMADKFNSDLSSIGL